MIGSARLRQLRMRRDMGRCNIGSGGQARIARGVRCVADCHVDDSPNIRAAV
jgi:hypothetical protein